MIIFHRILGHLNSIWRLSLISKLRLFAWKFIRGKTRIKVKLRKIDMDIVPDCPYCGSQLKDIDHQFRQCLCTKEA